MKNNLLIFVLFLFAISSCSEQEQVKPFDVEADIAKAVIEIEELFSASGSALTPIQKQSKAVEILCKYNFSVSQEDIDLSLF